MKRCVFFLTLFVAVILQITVHATTYYLDNVSGSDANNGKTITTPWKTIAKLNAAKLYPGDIILFKSGSVWKETIYLKNEGTASQPIRFSSYGTGNLPTLNGSGILQNGIRISHLDNIIIENIQFTNFLHGCIRVSWATGIIIRNCQFIIYGRAGVFIEETNNSKISNNKMSTPVLDIGIQTDGIYGQRNTNNVYEKNNIVISNKNLLQHCDGIQLYEETSAVVSSNYVELNNTKGPNSQGIYVEYPYGTFNLFNNVAYGLHTTSSLVKFRNYGVTNGTAKLIGNTIYGGKGYLFHTDDPNLIFKNNIVVTIGKFCPVRIEKPIKTVNITNNIYDRSGTGGIVLYKGSLASHQRTLIEWQAMGFDLNTLETDPIFTNPGTRDLSLKSNSKAINRGFTAGAPFNVDILGHTRSAGSYDIGAYEYGSTKFEMGADEISNETNDEKSAGKKGKTDGIETPDEFELMQNYPNPFNPSTTIRFALPTAGKVIIKIYDMLGKEVAEILNDVMEAGYHEALFNAGNLASGTYIYRIISSDFTESKKMILLK